MSIYKQTIFPLQEFNGTSHQSAVEKSKHAVKSIGDKIADGDLPSLATSRRTDDIADLMAAAKRFLKFKHVLILGTGGSSLGGKACYALSDRGFGNPKSPQLHFMDNVDPDSFTALFAAIQPRECGIIAISKSGNTAETLCQLHIICDWIDAKQNPSQLLVITEPGGNVLRQLAESIGCVILDHNPKIGGRYSVLSNVGMLPAALAGLDVNKIRAGAKDVLDQTLAGDPTITHAASMGVVLNRDHGIAQNIMMPYCDRLRVFGQWYKQLWGESLGKRGLGTTPVDALGTVDQHSQLQLYLEGPRDKFFTLIFIAQSGLGKTVTPQGARDSRLNYLYGRSMGDLIEAEQRATLQTLKNKHLPIRLIELPKLDEYYLGALFMHFMLETIVTADLMQIDPFDQPAVEEGKILTRAYLEKLAA